MIIFNFIGIFCIGKTTLINIIIKDLNLEKNQYYSYGDYYRNYKENLITQNEWDLFEINMLCKFIDQIKNQDYNIILFDNVLKNKKMYDYFINNINNIILINIYLKTDFNNKNNIIIIKNRFNLRNRDNVNFEKRLYNYLNFVEPYTNIMINKITLNYLNLENNNCDNNISKFINFINELNIIKQNYCRSKFKYTENIILNIYLKNKKLYNNNNYIQEYYFYLKNNKIYETENYFLTKNDKYDNRYLIWLNIKLDVNLKLFENGKCSYKNTSYESKDFYQNIFLYKDNLIKTENEIYKIKKYLENKNNKKYDIIYHHPMCYNIIHFHLIPINSEFIHDYNRIKYLENIKYEEYNNFTIDIVELYEIFKNNNLIIK